MSFFDPDYMEALSKLKKEPVRPPKPLNDAQLLKELERTASHVYAKAVDRLGGRVYEFSGPCGDSFCYGSCDMASCRHDLRLGKTPAEHNAVIEVRANADPNFQALSLLIKKTKTSLEKTCTHDNVEVRYWEWDDGYGTQKKQPEHKCLDCGKVNHWPNTSKNWDKDNDS